MRVPRKTAAIVAGTFALAGTAGGVAIATSGSDREDAVIADAAQRLNVTPEKLRGALKAAEDAQIDKQVADGTLTQKQADELKQHTGDHVLGGPGVGGPPHGGPGFGPGGPGHFGPSGPMAGPLGDVADAVAKALGISKQKLFSSVRDGTSLEDLAKANGTSLADVKSAARTALRDSLADAVKDDDLTQGQADEILSHFDEAFDHFADGPPAGGPGFGHRGGPGGFRHP